ALRDRLREVRVFGGDWSRVLTRGMTYHGNAVAVFLDPPYAGDVRSAGLYREDGADVAESVRAWAIEHGNDPRFRIALCGYENEHGDAMPNAWSVHQWSSGGGFGASVGSRGRDNAKQERIWFSPHCLPLTGSLFDE
ncbi:MAG: hypothetical protein ACPGWS_10120, partial [Solirubrobacterales bacterium]